MRRNYLPVLAALLVLPLAAPLAVPAPVAPAQARSAGTVPLTVSGAPLLIERPADWQEGGVRGLGIVHSFIGDHDGLPAFSVQQDPESRLPEETTGSQVDAAIEDLFGAILHGRASYVVEHAGWITLNGLRVHSSLTGYGSVAGPLVVRRIIVAHERAPIIFAWTVERDDWSQLSALVEKCVASLRLQSEAFAAR